MSLKFIKKLFLALAIFILIEYCIIKFLIFFPLGILLTVLNFFLCRWLFLGVSQREYLKFLKQVLKDYDVDFKSYGKKTRRFLPMNTFLFKRSTTRYNQNEGDVVTSRIGLIKTKRGKKVIVNKIKKEYRRGKSTYYLDAGLEFTFSLNTLARNQVYIMKYPKKGYRNRYIFVSKKKTSQCSYLENEKDNFLISKVDGKPELDHFQFLLSNKLCSFLNEGKYKSRHIDFCIRKKDRYLKIELPLLYPDFFEPISAYDLDTPAGEEMVKKQYRTLIKLSEFFDENVVVHFEDK